METKTCSSLKKEITNDAGSVSFACPQCGEATIVRSKNSREIMAKYTCPKCGFTGPN